MLDYRGWSYLHNSTLASLSDYMMKLNNTIARCQLPVDHIHFIGNSNGQLTWLTSSNCLNCLVIAGAHTTEVKEILWESRSDKPYGTLHGTNDWLIKLANRTRSVSRTLPLYYYSLSRLISTDYQLENQLDDLLYSHCNL